jgi:Glycine rich protein
MTFKYIFSLTILLVAGIKAEAQNVGIGTTAPKRTFVVRNDSTSANTVVAELASSSGDKNFHLVTTKGDGLNISGSVVTKIGLLYGDANANHNAYLRFHRGNGIVGGFLSFSTDTDMERMRIDANGNVGIGTSAPAQKLQVQVDNNGFNIPLLIQNLNGTQNGATANGNNSVGIGFLNEGGGNWYKAAITHERTGAFGIGKLHFLVNGTADANPATFADTRMTVTSAGVGIGTTTPNESALLDVTSANKGFLPPRVALTGSNDVTTIPNPVAALTVYNTNTRKLNVWDGSTWTAPINTTEQPYQNPTVTFNYTGNVQPYIVPQNVFAITVDATGAAGGNTLYGAGGKGGRVQTTLTVTPGETLNIYVGSSGGFGTRITGAPGGYNGGGSSYGYTAGGGGATDIRRNGTALSNRILVAGGGGGAGYYDSAVGLGGAGGGLVGGSSSGGGITGGSQTAGGNIGGTLGQGSNSVFNSTDGGGGGGYYGGGGTNNSARGGGGGSSFVVAIGSAGTLHTQGYQLGNASLTIVPNLVYPQPVIGVANLTGTLPAIDGNALTNLNAANLTGTINGARLPNPLPAIDGNALTNLNAANLTGTINGARLPNPLPAIDGNALTNLNMANLTGTWANQSQTTNGYVKMGGLILQWGTVPYTTWSGIGVNFPIAFPNNVFSITTNVNDVAGGPGGNTPCKTTAITNASFNIRGQAAWSGTDNSTLIKWIAIGN